MNPDLVFERSKCTFDMNQITYMLDGGIDRTKRRRELEELIQKDTSGVFDNAKNIYLHRTERYVRSLAKHVRLIELCRTIGIGKNIYGFIIADPDFVLLLNALGDDLPTSLHWVMFVPNLYSLCNKEQLQKWLPLCRDWYMIGCYAQTELGHGSNVRALETTATFVRDNENDDDDGSFIIHSPTLTSTKFWPGTLGRTANHAMVIARLIDGDGIDRGIHNFLVPLRSMKDHTLLPGVTTGDIGPKIGYNMMDNGYASFQHVKIPRTNMAMKFASVDKYGKYKTYVTSTNDAAAKIAYITMMQVRAYIVNEAGKNLAMACTIAIRYSAVRRQGYISNDNNNNNNNNNNNTNEKDDTTATTPKEQQVLDYKQQQHRLFPLLASSYCFFFMGKNLLQRLKDMENSLVRQKGKPISKQDVADIHASSSGLKSYTTTITADGIEECRKSCGGHGFLACSGLPELLTTYLQNPTVEGDNNMLPQHVVKVLLKLVQAVVSNNDDEIIKFQNCDSYLLLPSMHAIIQYHQEQTKEEAPERKQYHPKPDILRCTAQSPNDLLDLTNVVLVAYRHRATRLLLEIANQLEEYIMEKGMVPEEAWNQNLIEMARCSRAYSQFLLLSSFVNGIQEEQKKGMIGLAEVNVLTNLAQLLGNYWMEKDIGDFLEDEYMTQQQASWVRKNVLQLLDVIRPNAVPLVDARDFSDFRLKSALGRYDGNVYPAIMEAAKNDPLNQQEPGPGYAEHLKRLIVDGVGKYSPDDKKKMDSNNFSGTASRL